MAAIGFIGASGLMGHGMARNLLAKGHAVSLTVHRNRERVADLLAAGANCLPTALLFLALGALAFATVFAALVRRSRAAGASLTSGFQGVIGVLAIASGAWLLVEIVNGGG